MARYGDLVDVVENLRLKLKNPTVNARVIEAVLSMAEGGERLGSRSARKVFTEIFPEIAPILRSDKELHTTMEVLQRVYQEEVRGQMKFTDALDWFLNSRSKLVGEIRLLLTGIDVETLRFVLQVTGERAISANNLVRAADFGTLKKAFTKIVTATDPRLARLLKEFADKDVIPTLHATRFITDFHFWRIKGAVMEILSDSVKQDYLEKIKLVHPNAILIEGVMAMTRLTRLGLVTAAEAPRQIWDGIIAELTPSGLLIHVKFEVKSGMQGFQQGFEQILNTHYSRFTSFGDELHVVLPNGSKRVFTLSKKSARDAIRGEKSLNVLITPEGVSMVMPNQQLRSDDLDMITQLLELGGREVTHTDVEALVMDFLLSL
ncbi:MAG: hypothetical protein U1F54_14040 [Burkholderiales bacterium]